MSRFGGIHIDTLNLRTTDTVEIDISQWRTVQVQIFANTYGGAIVDLECSGDNGSTWNAVRDAGSSAIKFTASGLQPLPIEIGVMKCRLIVSNVDLLASTDAAIYINLKK